jgi:hypothetical protein
VAPRSSRNRLLRCRQPKPDGPRRITSPRVMLNALKTTQSVSNLILARQPHQMAGFVDEE